MGRGYPIYGRGGVEVWDYWKQVGVPRSYMGLMLHGFPNLFWAIGPNSQVWSSFFEVIETKIDLAAKLVKHMMLTNAKSFEPRLDLEEQWSQMCMERLKTTPYAAGCISYYKWQKSSPHINGKEEMKKDEETYYPAWFPGVPSELRELSDNATPNEFVWAPKTDGKWDVPTPPVNSPWKEDRMKATPIKLRGEGARL